MAFFEELSKKAQLYAEVAVEKTKDLAETVGDKAKAAADTAKTNMAIMAEQHELEKCYKAIGEWFAAEYTEEIPDALKDVMAAVAASKERIAELEASRAAASQCEEEEPVVEATLKVCPACGLAASGNYCPECGAKLGE